MRACPRRTQVCKQRVTALSLATFRPPRTGAFPAPEPGADTLGEARRKIFGIALPDDQG